MLAYCSVGGLQGAPILSYPSSGPIPAFSIPLTITDYKVASANAKVVTTIGVPYISVTTNTTKGGTYAALGNGELPKLMIAGYWDNPMTAGTLFNTFIASGGPAFRVSYAHLVQMYMDGSANQFDLDPGSVDPILFRDPYGRSYPNPRVVDFTSSYTEAAPQRQSFQLTFQLTGGVSV